MSGLIQSGIQFAQDLAQRFLPPPEPPVAEMPDVAANLSADQPEAADAQIVEVQATDTSQTPQTPQAPDAALPKSEVQLNERFYDGAMTGKEVVNFNDGNPVVATQRSQYGFTNVDSAAAYARSLDTPAAVVKEDGRFAVYKLEEQRAGWQLWAPDLSLDNIKPAAESSTPEISRSNNDVAAVTTSDDYIVRFNTSGTPQLDTTGSARGPFVGHTEAFGTGLKGLNDQGRFERQFDLAMRDTAFTALDASKVEAERVLGRLQGSSFSSTDRAAITSTLPALESHDRLIAAKKQEINDVFMQLLSESQNVGYGLGMSEHMLDSQMEHYTRSAQLQEQRQTLEAELQNLEAERTVVAKDAPLLLRVDLEDFKAMSEAEQVATLREQAQGVLSDIETTRQNIEDGDINLWMVDGIRNTTAAGLGLEGEQAQWVQDRGAGEKRSDAAWKIAEGVLTVGLAVGGAFFSGGTSLVLLGGAFALGAKGALDITNEYVTNKAAANTNVDPTGGLLPQESVPHVGFVVAAWVGLGLDAAAVSNVVRGLNAGRVTLQQAATSLGTDAKTLQAIMAAGEINTLKTSSMAGQEFVEQFGKSSGEAVTLLRRGDNGALQVEVVVRSDLSPAARNAAVREELVHLMQTADPNMSAKLGKLTEESLSNWNNLSDAQKLDLYQTKLDVELDAQRRLADSATDPASRARHEGHIDGLQQKLDEVNEAIASGKSPNWLAGAEPPRLFSVRTPLPTASPSTAALTDVGAQLTSAKVQGHVYETNFIERAVVSANGSITLTNGKKITVDGVLALQPDRAGAQITKVEVLNPDGSTLGRTGQVGNVQNAIPYDAANPSTVRISFERTDSTGAVVSDTVEWVTDQALPTGFRVQLQTNASFMKTGVAGGHTREAWQETTQLYNGVLREVGSPDTVRFSVNGVDTIDASKITYEANRASGWQQVGVPKTIFESTPSMRAFEQHMSPHVAEALEVNTLDRLVDVSVPVYAKDGKTLTSVKVTIAREPDPSGTGPGKVVSWWLSESNFSNALIK
jgi:hypothetical protein